jgi:4-diphosphocytidyl-2-C-methyl-D-erythritol kinase
VLGAREDGFHEVRSLVIGVDWQDRVSCERRDEPGIAVGCTDKSLAGPENLACRAARALARLTGHVPALTIQVEKCIPVGGGLGGGSSDAAATLRLCNALWAAGLDEAALGRLGAELGSDVPLFFSLPAALVTGRGEHVTPVTMRWSGWILLVATGLCVSTRDVYAAWRTQDNVGLPHGCDRAIAEAEAAEVITPMLSNHLEPAVFRVSPGVADARDALNRAGHGPMRVTGAGSTLYRLFDEEEDAASAARRIVDLHKGVRASVVAAPIGPTSVFSEES